MKKNLLTILALLAVGFLSCKQIAYVAPPPATSASYFPQTIGSNWVYRDSVFGEKTDTVPIYGVKNDTISYTINGGTTDFNSQICYNATVVSKVHGPSTAYFYAKNHLFGLLESTAPMGFTDILFLVDSAYAGYTWATVPSLNTLYNGSPIQSINTIVEKDMNKIVGGQTYTNVVHTSANFQVNVDGAGFKNVAYFDFYFARGIGLIEKDAYYYGNLNEVKTLVSSVIK
jgi:hypothetical protein